MVHCSLNIFINTQPNQIMEPSILLFLLYLFFLHWLGDFFFQNDKTAINKSEDCTFLAEHVIICTLVFVLLAPMLIFMGKDLMNLLPFLAVNFVAHFVIDFYTSKANAVLFQQEKRHEFFVSIGFDQWLHHATLLWTSHLFLL